MNSSLDLFKDDYFALKPTTRELLLVNKEENKMKVVLVVLIVVLIVVVLIVVVVFQEFQSFKYMGFAAAMVVTAVEWHPKRRGW